MKTNNPCYLEFRFLLLLLISSAACLCRSEGSTLLVYNNNDSGAGSLRQAILDNNTLGGGYTIIFSNSVSGTIRLTTGELLINQNVTILGPGRAVVAVNANYPNNTNRVFDIGPNHTVAISGLTI